MSTQAHGQEVLEIHEAVRQGQRQVLHGLRGGLPEARGERVHGPDADGVGLTSLTTSGRAEGFVVGDPSQRTARARSPTNY